MTGYLLQSLSVASCTCNNHVLAIIIHNITKELSNLVVASEKRHFLWSCLCHGWAKSCYLLNSSSISGHLQLTFLNPLVALGCFLIRQKPSLQFIDRNDDKTIQLLYTIAQQIFGEGLKENESVITAEDLDKFHPQCTKAKTCLLENVLDESSRKRTPDCLDQALITISDPRKKTSGSVLSKSSDNFASKD